MVGIGAGVLLAIGIVVAVVGQYAAVHVGGADDQYANISLDTPTIGRARSSANDELVDYVGTGGKRPGVAARPGAVAAAPGSKPKMGQADSEGMQMGEADQEMINGVIGSWRMQHDVRHYL